MPARLVEGEIDRGELARINPAGFDPITARLVLGGVYSTYRPIGPAAKWMIKRLGGRTWEKRAAE